MKRLFKNFNQKEVQDPQGQLEVSCKKLFLLCQAEVRMCSKMIETCHDELGGNLTGQIRDNISIKINERKRL